MSNTPNNSASIVSDITGLIFIIFILGGGGFLISLVQSITPLIAGIIIGGMAITTICGRALMLWNEQIKLKNEQVKLKKRALILQEVQLRAKIKETDLILFLDEIDTDREWKKLLKDNS